MADVNQLEAQDETRAAPSVKGIAERSSPRGGRPLDYSKWNLIKDSSDSEEQPWKPGVLEDSSDVEPDAFCFGQQGRHPGETAAHRGMSERVHQSGMDGMRPCGAEQGGQSSNPSSTFQVGAVVKIFGLRNSAHLNGRDGIIKGQDESSGRWQVELPKSDLGFEVKLVRFENLILSGNRSVKPRPDIATIAQESDRAKVGRQLASNDAHHGRGPRRGAAQVSDFKESLKLGMQGIIVGSLVFVQGLMKKLKRLNGRHGVVRGVANQSAQVELHTPNGGTEIHAIAICNLELRRPSTRDTRDLLEDTKRALAADPDFRVAILFEAQSSVQEAAKDETQQLSEALAAAEQALEAERRKMGEALAIAQEDLEKERQLRRVVEAKAGEKDAAEKGSLSESAATKILELTQTVEDLRTSLREQAGRPNQKNRMRALQDRLRKMESVKDAKESAKKAEAELHAKQAEAKVFLEEADRKEKSLREAEEKQERRLREERALLERKAQELRQISRAREELDRQRELEEQRRAKELEAIREKQEQLQRQRELEEETRLRELQRIQHEKAELERRMSMHELVENFEEKQAALEQQRQRAEQLQAFARMQIRAEMDELEDKALRKQEELERQRRFEADERQRELQRIRAEREALERRKKNEELLVQIEQEKAHLQRMGSQGNAVAQATWQFEADDGSWTSFTQEPSDLMMEAFLKGERQCLVKHGGVTYTQDFDCMLQTNPSTRRQRQIRCNFGLPSHWSVSDEEVLQRLRPKAAPRETPTHTAQILSHFRRFFRGESSSETPSAVQRSKLTFENVAMRITDVDQLIDFTALLRNSVFHHDHSFCGPSQCDHWRQDFQVTEAFHVENVSLFKAYMDHCSRMRRKHIDHGVTPSKVDPPIGPVLQAFTKSISSSALSVDSLQECILFHGTTLDVAKQIAIEGFDSRVSRTGGYYGMGTYFASQACKSAQYAQDGTMILARVALGDPHFATEVKSDVRRPPIKNSRSICSDSIIARPGGMRNHAAGQQAHQEFVIFEQMQAYPEYILRFTMM